MAGIILALMAGFPSPAANAAPADSASQPPPRKGPAKNDAPAVTAPAPEQHFDIQRYLVQGGGHLLPRLDVETAVYPFLGPYRTEADVEQARGALEKAYRDKGFQTVSVQVPPQKVQGGVIVLQVMSGQVNRLRVHGSRYFSLDQIKREAPSLSEGQSPNFTQVTHDLAVLNNIADRRVTPTLRAGEIPGTVDVDLTVKDTPPVHGSLEVNNRYSADTTPLRLNGSVSYDNLWQLEHSIGFSFQLSPEDLNEVKVFSAYYVARIPGVDWLSLMLQGTDQDSNVSTLSGIGVAGKGQVIGGRAIMTLPTLGTFYQSLSLGLDYKHFTQEEQFAQNLNTNNPALITAPITYFPLSAAYSGTWANKGSETDLNASVNLGLRELGSSESSFVSNRFGASGDFLYLRGDLSHTHDLPGGFQIFAKAQGQIADGPLVNSEQFSGGGLGTVRGFLESEVLGDNALLGSVELRSPSLSGLLGKAVDEWRFYIFTDGGFLTVNVPLTETPYQYDLLSAGIGTRIKLINHLNGSIDIGVPLVADALESSVPAGAFVQNPIRERPYDAEITFRLWADF